jgi:hypothetical protein
MPVDTAARYVTRAFCDGDEDAILDLFARCFPHAPRTRESFDWKYRRNPFGSARISLTFDEKGELAGHYAGYPVPFVDRGESFLAHQIGDTMTSPAVRHVGRGPTSILGRTAAHFYSEFCEGKVAYNYGFNVANIQRFSMRFLRSDRVESVPYRVRDLHRDPLRRLTRAERWARGFQLEEVRSVGQEWDDFFDRVSPDFGFLVRRDAAYIRWRYLECPDVRYIVIAIRQWKRLAGWSVFRVRDGALLWGDALFDYRVRDAASVMLRHMAPVLGAQRIVGWFPARPRWFDRLLKDFKFELQAEPQDLGLMCVPFVHADAAERMRDRLFYTMGDSDLF